MQESILRITRKAGYILIISLVLSLPLSFGDMDIQVGVQKAGISSHQPNRWCPPGSFLVGFDLDGDRNLSAYDAPVIGQAMCASPENAQSIENPAFWVGVERVGINSHQPNRWCQPGSYLVGLDQDGNRNLSPYDAPVIGQAMCAPFNTVSKDCWCGWVQVEKGRISSHQLNRWCPQGSYLVGLDLDGDRRLSPHDAPVVGQAMCCSPCR